MSDRRDFYFEQVVTEAEMDEAFNDLEVADRALVIDNGNWGILVPSGYSTSLQVTESAVPAEIIDIKAGICYDQLGQRIEIPTTINNFDASKDYLGVATAVAGSGKEKYLAVFARFARALSDPRIDGGGTTIQYDRLESYSIEIHQGTEAAIGTATKVSHPGSGYVLLADIIRTYGDSTIDNSDIDMATLGRRDLAAYWTDGASGKVLNGAYFSGKVDLDAQVSGKEIIYAGHDGVPAGTAGVSDWDFTTSVGGSSAQLASRTTPSYIKYPIRIPDKAIITNVHVHTTQGGATDIALELRSNQDGAAGTSEAGPWTTGLGAGGGYTFDKSISISTVKEREYFLTVTGQQSGDAVLSVRVEWTHDEIIPS